MSRGSKQTGAAISIKPEAWAAPVVIAGLEAIDPNTDSQSDATVNDKQHAHRPTPAMSVSRPSPPGLALRHLRANAEIKAISQALERTGWNRRRAAELLSISYRGLLYTIRQYEITSASASELLGLPENAKLE